MQRKFAGFDLTSEVLGERGERFTGVPGSFFTQLLPQITHPNELKTLLYIMYVAGRKQSDPKWVGYWELVESEELLSGLRRGGDPRPPVEHLREALELCMARGSILRVEAAPPPPEFFGNGPAKGDLEPVTVTWFLLNTAGNREFLARLQGGEIQIEETNLLIGLDLWDSPLPLPEAEATTVSAGSIGPGGNSALARATTLASTLLSPGYLYFVRAEYRPTDPDSGGAFARGRAALSARLGRGSFCGSGEL